MRKFAFQLKRKICQLTKFIFPKNPRKQTAQQESEARFFPFCTVYTKWGGYNFREEPVFEHLPLVNMIETRYRQHSCVFLLGIKGYKWV